MKPLAWWQWVPVRDTQGKVATRNHSQSGQGQRFPLHCCLDSKGNGSFFKSFHCLTKETEKECGRKVNSDFVAELEFL